MKFFGVFAISSSIVSAAATGLGKRDACAPVQDPCATPAQQLITATPLGQVLIQQGPPPPPDYYYQPRPYVYAADGLLSGGQCLGRCMCKLGRCMLNCPCHLMGSMLGMGRYQYVPYSYPAYQQPQPVPVLQPQPQPQPQPYAGFSQLVAQPVCPPADNVQQLNAQPASPLVGTVIAIPVNKNTNNQVSQANACT